MSELLVVDASVALKWVVGEPDSDAAAQLLTELAAGSLSLIAPDHVVGEVGNGLRKRVAQQVLTAEEARDALEALSDLGLELVSDSTRWFRCLSAALNWQLTTYDALYVLLAQDLESELVTADARLVDAARRHCLRVRPLAA